MSHGNALGTLELAGARIRTVAESQFVHLGDHRLGAALGFRAALREQGEGADAGRDEEHRRSVLARGNASTATHAGRCVHAILGLVVRNQDVVGILRRASAHGDEAAGLEDLVKRGTVHDEVLDHGEGRTAPGLHRDGGAILEMAHEQLAGGHVVVRTVGTAINIESAGSADALTAVVVEGHRAAALAAALHGHGIATLADELLIEDIEHLQEGSILFDAGNMVGLKMSLGLGVFLTPYLQIEFHLA